MIEKRIKLKNSLEINVQYHIKNKQVPTILFLHFSGGTSQIWNGAIPLFGNDFNIIAPDYRGHGKSDRPETGYHIDDLANDIYLLLQELEITKCHVVGSSTGAEVGLSLAATHTEMVQSLVCEGAIYNEFGEYGLFEGTEKEIEIEIEKRNKQLAERKLPTYDSKTTYIEEMKASLEKHGLWNEYFSAFMKSCLEETEAGHFEHHYKNFVRTEYMEKYWNLRFEEYYKKVKCPVLFLPSADESGNERITRSLDYFTSFLDSYEIYHIKDAVHAYVWMQYPQIAGEVVKNFIENH